MSLIRRQMRTRRSDGFTLIELLVVVFLIGLISGFAVLSINALGNDRDIDEQIRRLQYQLRMASEESVVQGRPIGVQFEQGKYLFLIAGKSEWLEITNNKALRSQQLLRGWKFELQLGGQDFSLTKTETETETETEDSKTKPLPQIIFFSSGEIYPFELLVVDLDNTPRYRIWYGEDGVIAMELIEKS
jgi:general secretion pathway protein H